MSIATCKTVSRCATSKLLTPTMDLSRQGRLQGTLGRSSRQGRLQGTLGRSSRQGRLQGTLGLGLGVESSFK